MFAFAEGPQKTENHQAANIRLLSIAVSAQIFDGADALMESRLMLTLGLSNYIFCLLRI